MPRRANAGPLFHRDHYEAIAEVLQPLEEAGFLHGRVITDLCVMFGHDNPNFVSGTFIRAITKYGRGNG